MKTYRLIDAYEEVKDSEDWLDCPNCGLEPKVWCFDNGRSTGCGCGEDTYRHFSIYAESIMSVHTRCDGKTMEYDCDELKKNWNHWVSTGEELYKRPLGGREDGRW